MFTGGNTILCGVLRALIASCCIRFIIVQNIASVSENSKIVPISLLYV